MQLCGETYEQYTCWPTWTNTTTGGLLGLKEESLEVTDEVHWGNQLNGWGLFNEAPYCQVEGKLPIPPTHTCWTSWYYTAECRYLYVGVGILTEISDLSWWEIWQNRCENAPITPSPGYRKTCPGTNKCKRPKLQKFQQQVHCQVCPAHGVRSTNSYRCNVCVCGGGLLYFTECHSIVNL
jgi:hypothetical protein